MSKRQRKNWKQRHQREGERDPEAYLPHKCQRLRFPVGFPDVPTEIWAAHSPLPIFGFVRPTLSEHEFSTVKLGPTICERPTICEKRRTKTYHKYNYLLCFLELIPKKITVQPNRQYFAMVIHTVSSHTKAQFT